MRNFIAIAIAIASFAAGAAGNEGASIKTRSIAGEQFIMITKMESGGD